MPKLDLPEIDRLIETLTGVVRARVRESGGGDNLSEIHILSDGGAAPKQIVRNVETLLKTAFDLVIDHRIVSIAVLKKGADVDALTKGGGEGTRTMARESRPRVEFRRLRVVQEELKCTAHVELGLGDVIFEGSHRDTDTPRARVYASARAVIEALEYLAEKEVAFYLAGLDRLPVAGHDVLVVLIEGRQNLAQMGMLGSAFVRDDDSEEAAVRAVLDAVNRFMTRPEDVPQR